MLRGGNRPTICDELFTSKQLAESTLIKYLTIHDPLELAEYPGKGRKNEVGKSEDE